MKRKNFLLLIVGFFSPILKACSSLLEPKERNRFEGMTYPLPKEQWKNIKFPLTEKEKSWLFEQKRIFEKTSGDWEYWIVPELCLWCHSCVPSCPEDAIYSHGQFFWYVIDQERCTRCGLCVDDCPTDAIRKHYLP
jgi:ferredoxin